MSNGYVIPIDPSELENRFPSNDPLPGDEPIPEEEDVASLFSGADYENRIVPLLDLIPEREADLINLYYIQKKRQADIAAIFQVTQAAISYRLARGLHRLKFLLSIPQVSEEEMRGVLSLRFQEIDVNILVGMWRTTCQSEVATQLNLTQGRVRHRFFKSVDALKNIAEEDLAFKPYYEIFSSISHKNFNVLKEVKLPQWGGRGGDACY